MQSYWRALQFQLRQPLFWAGVIFTGVIAFHLAAVSIGWEDVTGGPHNFRQTQTAITCFYMLGAPLRLAYETPILGPPWSVPMEFPLFQWLVVAVTSVFGLPLIQAGRLVSAGFFLAALWPIYLILAALQVARAHRLLFLSVIVISPFYIFWARSFMIETTALFLSLAYLACAFSYMKSRPLIWSCWAVPSVSSPRW